MNSPNEPDQARLVSEAMAAKRPPRRKSPHVSAFQVASVAEPVLIKRGTMIGDYCVERRLDEGGMGTVYAAVHPVIDKRVAIKVLHPHVARQEEAVARFIQEARAVNAIGHPGIVDIFGFGRFVDGRHYITMEYLDGQQLLAFLNETGPIAPVEMLPLGIQLAESLAAAHDKGVVHRDMKPENVFLSVTAASVKTTPWPPRTKILDFGLAKLIEAEFDDKKPRTRAGVTVGTPYYMSPEQCRGKQVDQRADIYALGVMMYEMITGRVPFYAPESVDVLYMHLTQQPEPPSRHRTVPPDIEAMILRCMAKNAGERPASMTVLLAELERIQKKLSPDGDRRERPEEELKREASAFFGGVEDSRAGADGAEDSKRKDRITLPVIGQAAEAASEAAASEAAASEAAASEAAPEAGPEPSVASAQAPVAPQDADSGSVSERARSAAPVPALPSDPESAASAPASGSVPSLPTPEATPAAREAAPEPSPSSAARAEAGVAPAARSAPAPETVEKEAAPDPGSAPAPAPAPAPARAPTPGIDAAPAPLRFDEDDPEITAQVSRPPAARVSRGLLWALVVLQAVVIVLLMLVLAFRG